MYAVGRIPGSFNRREGKPSDRGILNSRIIDRPMRPLFDEELRNDTVVTCTVLANDYENPVEIVASLALPLPSLLPMCPGTDRLPPPTFPTWVTVISSTPLPMSVRQATASCASLPPSRRWL